MSAISAVVAAAELVVEVKTVEKRTGGCRFLLMIDD